MKKLLFIAFAFISFSLQAQTVTKDGKIIDTATQAANANAAIAANTAAIRTKIDSVKKYLGTDTIYQYKNGTPSFSYRYSRNYNVKDYGAKGDGVTDDQSAIQSTINVCNANGGGTVYFPNGIYILNSPVDGTSNSQLYLPLNSYTRTDTLRVIKLIGETGPNVVSQPFLDATTNAKPPQTGVILKSNISGTGNIIGARTQTVTWGNWNFAELDIENITVRSRSDSLGVHVAPRQTAINASQISMFKAKNVRVDTESAMDSTVQPASTAIGIYMPLVNNFAICYLENVTVMCMYNGIIIAEHTVGNNVEIDQCYYGLVGQGINYHGNYFSRLGIYRTNQNIYFPGGSGGVNIDQLALEDDLATDTYWFKNTSDLNEVTTGSWIGNIKFQRVESYVGVVNNKFRRSNRNASLIKASDFSGLNYYQPSGSTEYIQFRENFDSSGNYSASFGKAGNTMASQGQFVANDAYIYSESNIDFWSKNRSIKFLGGVSNPIQLGKIDSVGNVTFDAVFAGQKFLTVKNTSSAVTAQAIFSADNGTNFANYGVTGTGYTPYGALGASTPYLYTSASTGMVFMADNAAGVIKWATGGNTERMRLDASGRLGIGRTPTTDLLEVSGNLNLATAGNKIKIATGTNASVGTATLASGTVTVSTTAVTASSIITLTLQGCSNCGTPYISAKTAGTSFVISSTNVLDGSIVAYQIIN